jgi:hypothetical protein
MTLRDEFAHEIAESKFGLPWCLHTPIAARDEASIYSHVGILIEVVATGTPSRAVLVETEGPERMDPRLPIWREAGASNLFRSPQFWVHVDFADYRRAYAKAFPAENITSLDVDHILNRHVAKVKDFFYVRLFAISKAANRSSGGLSEKWAIEFHSSERMRAKNLASPARIQYADLADIVKMLDRKTGGSLQDPVNEAQAPIRAPK